MAGEFLEFDVFLDGSEQGVVGDFGGVGELLVDGFAELFEGAWAVAALGGDEGEAVGAGGGAGDDVADVGEGLFGVVEFLRDDVDAAEGKQHALVVAAQVTGFDAVLQGAVDVVELQADACEVEARVRVAAVDVDELLELAAGFGVIVGAHGDHRETEMRFGERARFERRALVDGLRVALARRGVALELEQRFAAQDEQRYVAGIRRQARVAFGERFLGVAGAEIRVRAHAVLGRFVDATGCRKEQQGREDGTKTRDHSGGRTRCSWLGQGGGCARGLDAAGKRLVRRARQEQAIELTWPGKDRLEAHVDGVGWSDLELLERARGSKTENLLISGDNLVAMRALEEKYAGRVDLIYIDPPYSTGLSYYTQTELGERRAYRDDRAGGMVGYLDAMYLRLAGMHRLLSDDGKLFLHCDWRASSMLRLVLDEIFGPDCHRNEIIWRRAPNLGRQAASKQLGRVYDSIYVYSKTPGSTFPGPVPKRRAEVPLDRSGKPKGARWDPDREAYFTTAPRGDYTDLSIAKLRQEGRVFESSTGTIYIKYFLTLGDDGRWYKEQPVDALWDDFEVRPLRHRPKSEDMGYDTQKPQGLLERIIGWATRPGDLVADFFCGSGTTPAVAQAMGRRWIACDTGATAIDVTRRRILSKPGAFELMSVTRAERVRWARLMGDDVTAVLTAYGAERLDDTRDGTVNGERITVGPLDRAIDARTIELACERARDGRLTVLAWEWDDSDPKTLRERARERGVELTLRTIPIELVRDDAPRRVRFVERAEFDAEVVRGEGGTSSVRLIDVRCPDPPPIREQSGTPAGWSDLVAAWWIDFEARDAFAPTWGSQRDGSAPLLESPAQAIASQVRVRVVTVYGDQIDRRIG